MSRVSASFSVRLSYSQKLDLMLISLCALISDVVALTLIVGFDFGIVFEFLKFV